MVSERERERGREGGGTTECNLGRGGRGYQTRPRPASINVRIGWASSGEGITRLAYHFHGTNGDDLRRDGKTIGTWDILLAGSECAPEGGCCFRRGNNGTGIIYKVKLTVRK